MSRTKKTATHKSNATKSPATADRRKPKAATTVGKTSRRTKALGDNGIPPWRMVLQGAVRTFNDLCSEYEAAKNGYRVSLYKFAEQCYKVGNTFNTRTDQFARFKDDPFWANVRQKPKDDKKMRAVLVYATKSNPGAFASLITKTAKVLEDMATRGVKANDVAKRLKEGGGIEKMYAALSPNRIGNSRVPDDLEMLVPSRSEGDTEDGCAEVEPTSEGARSDDGDWFAESEESDADVDLVDDPVGKPPTMPRAASDGPMTTEFGGIASPPKHPPFRAVFDPNKHLLVDMSAISVTIDEALNMGGMIIKAVVEAADDSGYRAVKAVSVNKAPLIAGRRKKLDNDETGD